MIPKIIHFCWLSNDAYPPLIKKCINTWKEKLPDYELVLWDTNRFNLDDNIWAKQAFESKKYAFAADYIRLHAVYNYGGIYLDTDIEVIKSFNNLLECPYFIGSEGDGIIEAGVLGAEKHSDWVKQSLDYYTGKEFIKIDGSFNTKPLPNIMTEQISQIKTFKETVPENISAAKMREDSNTIFMFSKDYFCAKNHGTGVIEKTTNTYCIHHYAMSWLPNKTTFLPNLKRKLMRLFGVNSVDRLIYLLRLRELKDTLKK